MFKNIISAYAGMSPVFVFFFSSENSLSAYASMSPVGSAETPHKTPHPGICICMGLLFVFV